MIIRWDYCLKRYKVFLLAKELGCSTVHKAQGVSTATDSKRYFSMMYSKGICKTARDRSKMDLNICHLSRSFRLRAS